MYNPSECQIDPCAQTPWPLWQSMHPVVLSCTLRGKRQIIQKRSSNGRCSTRVSLWNERQPPSQGKVSPAHL